MVVPSGSGNDRRPGSGENSAQETSWREQEAIDSSGLPSDACLLAYLQAQGTGLKIDPAAQLLKSDSTVPTLPNVSTTQNVFSNFFFGHSHAFDQQQVDGKLATLGRHQSLEEQNQWTTSIDQQGMKEQISAYLQVHGSADFRPSVALGRSEGGEEEEGRTSSLPNHQFMYGGGAALPGTRWSSSAATDFDAAFSNGNFPGRATANHFQQLHSSSNLLMAMNDSDERAADTRTQPFPRQIASLGAGHSEIALGSYPRRIWTPSEQEEGEQTSITTSQQVMNQIDGSGFAIPHKAQSLGQFEPRSLWGSMRSEEHPREQLSLAQSTTRLSNIQGNSSFFHQSDNASIRATAPLSLDGPMSVGHPTLWDNLLSITSTMGDFSGATSLASRGIVANQEIAINLMHQHQVHQNDRMQQEQVEIPRGKALRISTPAGETSELGHLKKQHEQLHTGANFMDKEDSTNRVYKGSSSTLARATSGAGIGAWSAASAELLDDLETYTREKTNRFKKKSTNKPKRPLSAYNIFFKEERERILHEIPDDDVAATSVPSASQGSNTSSRNRRAKRTPHGKIDFQSLAKVVGKRWQNLSPEAMAVYKEKANDDLVRYKREMQEFTDKAVRPFEERTELHREGEL